MLYYENDTKMLFQWFFGQLLQRLALKFPQMSQNYKNIYEKILEHFDIKLLSKYFDAHSCASMYLGMKTIHVKIDQSIMGCNEPVLIEHDLKTLSPTFQYIIAALICITEHPQSENDLSILMKANSDIRSSFPKTEENKILHDIFLQELGENLYLQFCDHMESVKENTILAKPSGMDDIIKMAGKLDKHMKDVDLPNIFRSVMSGFAQRH